MSCRSSSALPPQRTLSEICEAVVNDDVDRVRRILQELVYPDPSSLTLPLFVALETGNAGVVQILIEANAEKDKADQAGRTPLFIASRRGCTEPVRFLCESGADKDKADAESWTPLGVASFRGHTNVVVALCKNGADKDKADCDGWTPLLIAYRMMHVDAERILARAVRRRIG